VVHAGVVSGVNEGDQKSYQDYHRLLQRFANALKPFWLKTIPRMAFNKLAAWRGFAHIGLNIRCLGKQDMREFMRVFSLPTRDLMDENFDDDHLKAVLSWDALIGSKLAPRSPNNAVLALLYRMTGEHQGAHTIPVHGVAGLIDALRSSASAAGAEIRTGAAVDRILVSAEESGLAVSGVKLADGTTIDADCVVSTADPQTTFLKLLGIQFLEIGFSNRIRRLRCVGQVAKLHLALSALPRFTGLERPDGRMIIAPCMDAIEFAYDHAKYGEWPQQPVMEIVLPSLHDAAMAPAGQQVLSAHVMYVPYQLQGGWDDQARAALCERLIDTIAQYAPDIREQIIHQELLTPLDLEQKFQVSGGHWHHTEFALDQLLMMRPTYEAAQYSTPIAGLYLGGAGCHPGGDLTGAPGHNASREILR